MADVDYVIERSAHEIATRQKVERPSREAGEVSSEDGGSKEAEILEAICLGALSATDHRFRLRASLAAALQIHIVETYSFV